MLKRPEFNRRFLFFALMAPLTAAGFWMLSQAPKNQEWSPEAAVLPWAEFKGDKAIVHNVRNNDYVSEHEFKPAYEERTLHLDKISSAWFVFVPFPDSWLKVAHTFISFGFEDGTYLSVSVEVRKKAGESYSPYRGLLPHYKLIYVVADERDLIRLRANFRGDEVYLYPVDVPKDKMRGLLTTMLERANRLREKPEFYNTITNNCTNNIVRHVNSLVPGKVPFSYRVLLPGYSDRLAYDLGLLDNSVPFEELRRRHYVSEAARKAGRAGDFSKKIRSWNEPR